MCRTRAAHTRTSAHVYISHRFLGLKKPSIVDTATMEYRRGDYDMDADEAATIWTAIQKYTNEKMLINSDVCFISTSDLIEPLSKALGEHLTSRGVTLRLKAHIGAGRLPQMRVERSRTARGFTVNFKSVTLVTDVSQSEQQLF